MRDRLHSGETPSQTGPWYGWEEEEGGHGWLLSYVDMLSVMLAVMVVLLGHLAAQRLEAVPQAVATAAAAAAAEPLSRPAAPTVDAAPAQTVSEDPQARLAEAVQAQLAGWVRAVRDGRGVSLEIADAILFESGSAELRESAWPVLTQLAVTLLQAGAVQVAVEGHTDSRPIQGGPYRSNWELAAARATAVTRFLIAQGLAPERLRSVSYADTRPVTQERNEAGLALNRRVNLVVEFPSAGEGAGGAALR